MIYVDLPVADLQRSVKFFQALGFTPNPWFPAWFLRLIGVPHP
jgi:predicted lactoylglutathione lyase